MPARKSVPSHAETFDRPSDFKMFSYAEEWKFVEEAEARFPELKACAEARHAVMVLRLALPTGTVRTVGCWKCRTSVYRGHVLSNELIFKVVAIAAASGPCPPEGVPA
jgi:hypothetical protein